MLLPSAVHVSSTFEFGAVFHDCLSADPKGNPPFSPFVGSPSTLLTRAVHVSSTFEFGAVFHDCLSVDPLVQSSILAFFSEPHELRSRSCILHPMSLELCFMID